MKNRIFYFIVSFAAYQSVVANPVNLIPNFDFASSITGWTCSGTCYWSPVNATNDGTGSLAFDHANQAGATSGCFRVSASTHYTYGFKAKTSIGPAGDEFNMSCNSYTDTGCSSFENFGNPADLVVAESEWESQLYTGDLTTGASAQSANCMTGGGRNGGATNYDDFFFVPPDKIFADNFGN
ncbi:hypothetical protein ELE36_13035 [Pseudolysobacter antarcticus]|uniref:CBM-cenC domain-containing protein n=1 Tax=Pseudolysobacter antarcticus TaxID=2511995 RepID=A0A411HKZ6_9GAMM|nr:hypothetical protein [Pseudolysobacter antarcticus]QBB71202.1 hypothetical protein ELE36_13035 [Pseudolysobacter antarcticus]